MKKKMVQVTITLLIVAFIGSSFLMIAPIDEAEAWWRHACNCIDEFEFSLIPPSIKYKVKCDVTYHWNPLPHDFSCS